MIVAGVKGLEMESRSRSLIVYYDGDCPVCSREIGFYQRRHGAEAIRWLDVSQVGESALGPDLTRAQALARFHVREADGTLVDGSQAFLRLWQRLPAFAWFGRRLDIPAVTWVLDRGYAGFLFLRRRFLRRPGGGGPAAPPSPTKRQF